MLSQPLINQLLAGQWTPLQRSNWHLATASGNAVEIASKLRLLGVADAAAIDMTGYTDSDGNYHNDVVGMFQYLDPGTRFWGVKGTLVQDGVNIPIYEVGGDMWDRQTKPNAFFDKAAPKIIGGNQENFPNGANLKIKAYPSEGYATLYWDFQP